VNGRMVLDVDVVITWPWRGRCRHILPPASSLRSPAFGLPPADHRPPASSRRPPAR